MYVYCFNTATSCMQKKRFIKFLLQARKPSWLNYLLGPCSRSTYITLGLTSDMCYFKCLVDVFKGVYVYLDMCSKCSECSINNNNTANIVSVDLTSLSDLICLLSHSFMFLVLCFTNL